MIHVIATIALKPGQRDAFLQHFHRLMPKVHAEQGCIEYGPASDADTGIDTQCKIGPDKVMVVEKWASLDALKAHLTAPHMLEYRKNVHGLVVSTELRVLDPA